MKSHSAVLLLLLLVCPFALAQETDLSVVKNGPEQAPAGSNVTYTVTVTNIGGNDALVVDVTDAIPPGMTFVSATPAAGFTCSNDAAAVVCSAPLLAAGASATFTFVFNIPSGTEPGTTFTNIATASTETPDVNEENDSGVAVTTTPQPALADVGVAKSGPTSAGPDTDVVYTITVRNAGPQAASDVELRDTLPGTMTFESLTQSGAPFACSTPAIDAGGTIVCTAATLPAGASTTFTLTGHVPPGTPTETEFQNTATVTSSNDPNVENDRATTTLTVSRVDVSVVKSGPAVVTAGADVPYTLEVRNAGPDAAADVIFTDVIPAGTTFVSLTYVSGVAGACTANGAAGCTFATLASGATSRYSLVLRAGDTTSISNTANVSTASFDTDPSDNSSTATTTVTPSADLAVTKSGPASATAGTNATYSVTLRNNGPSTASNVTLTDTLPAGTTFVSVAQTGGPTFTCGQAAGVVTCTRATFAPLATASFTIVVTVAPEATGTITNTAAVSATTPDPAAGNNAATAPTSVTASADLAVSKIGPAAATAGTNVTYAVTLTNHGPSAATDVTLTDTLPAGTTFVSATQTSGPAFTCTPAAGVVTCTRATLAAGAAATFDVTVAVAAETTGTISNTAAVTAATPDPVPGNNAATSTANAAASADLAVTKSGPAAPTAGTNATYTVTVTNNGPSTATDVTLTDTLPPGTTYVSTSQTNGPAFSCPQSAGVVTCTRATFAPLATASFDIVVAIPAGTTGPLTNAATVTAATPDPVPANNTATATSGTGTAADLSVAKLGPGTATAGTSVRYTVDVTNHGPSTASNVTLTDTLPPGTSFVSVTQISGPSFQCAHAAGVVTCAIASLAPTTTALFSIVATVGPGATGTLVNTAAVSSSTPDPSTANNVSTTATVLDATADLEVAKNGPATATAGNTVTYTVTVNNNGISTAANVTLTDTLPAGTPAGTTFTSVTQTGGPAFTCEQAARTITCTRATLAPLMPATFEIAVSVPLTAFGLLTDVAEVRATTPDPMPTNNRATAVTDVRVAPADLTIAKTANAPELFVGARAIFTILVRNDGPGRAEDVVVTDILPAGSTLESAPGCTGTATVTCNVGTLAAGTTATFTLTVRMPSTSGPVTNTATVTSTTPDPTPGNNAGTATITAVAVPAAIPTLSEWALILLALALAAAAMLRR